ncbi:Hypothetical protein GSB_154124 [Giardia duodenalis]|uniref:Uncharacterized protein n=2 Tax=Giardia intestinalis TaxID=5741 RepID=C6LWZ7_GIAIB|nr:Hypothetical protein GL50581_3312 [Giardia intestinalis ATCC 50581]ESU42820.1 Hypothetical protein GSB_154124 [Giardia intestinalis]
MDDFFGFGDNVPDAAPNTIDPFAPQAATSVSNAEDMFGFGDTPAVTAPPMLASAPAPTVSFFPGPEQPNQPVINVFETAAAFPAPEPVAPVAAPVETYSAPAPAPAPPSLPSVPQASTNYQSAAVPAISVPVVQVSTQPGQLPSTLTPYAPLPPAMHLSPEYEAALNDPEVLVAYQRDNSIAKTNEIKYKAFQNLQDKNHEAAKALVYQQSIEYRKAYMEKFQKEGEARKAQQCVKREKVRRALLEGGSVPWVRVRSLARDDATGSEQALRQLEAIKAKSTFDYRANELLNK